MAAGGSDEHARIAQRAKEIWEAEGRPEGRAAEHWARAEKEIAEAARPQGDRSRRVGAGEAEPDPTHREDGRPRRPAARGGRRQAPVPESRVGADGRRSDPGRQGQEEGRALAAQGRAGAPPCG